MEETERIQRVWQRVRGGAEEAQPEQWMAQLLRDVHAETELWQQLGRAHGGVYGRIARQKQSQMNCLRGIWRIAAGQHWQTPKQTRPEKPDLRRSCARGMALWRVFDDHCRDPEFGPVFQSLRDQQREHCRIALELLGHAGGSS